MRPRGAQKEGQFGIAFVPPWHTVSCDLPVGLALQAQGPCQRRRWVRSCGIRTLRGQIRAPLVRTADIAPMRALVRAPLAASGPHAARRTVCGGAAGSSLSPGRRSMADCISNGCVRPPRSLVLLGVGREHAFPFLDPYQPQSVGLARRELRAHRSFDGSTRLAVDHRRSLHGQFVHSATRTASG